MELFNMRPALIKSKQVYYFGNPKSIYITIHPLIIGENSWPPIFSSNPEATDFIEADLVRDPKSNNTCWEYLTENPNAVHIIEEPLVDNPEIHKSNSSKIHWDPLCKNKNAIELVRIAIFERNNKLNVDNFTKLNDEKIHDK